MCCVFECYKGGIVVMVMIYSDLASTLCKYDLRKGDLCVPNWARV